MANRAEDGARYRSPIPVKGVRSERTALALAVSLLNLSALARLSAPSATGSGYLVLLAASAVLWSAAVA
jgi:hypothetical protein